jgi:hypothetical protein
MTIRIRIENVHSAPTPEVEVVTVMNYSDGWTETQSTKVPPLEIREFWIHSGQRLLVKEII